MTPLASDRAEARSNAAAVATSRSTSTTRAGSDLADLARAHHALAEEVAEHPPGEDNIDFVNAAELMLEVGNRGQQIADDLTALPEDDGRPVRRGDGGLVRSLDGATAADCCIEARPAARRDIMRSAGLDEQGTSDRPPAYISRRSGAGSDAISSSDREGGSRRQAGHSLRRSWSGRRGSRQPGQPVLESLD